MKKGVWQTAIIVAGTGVALGSFTLAHRALHGQRHPADANIQTAASRQAIAAQPVAARAASPIARVGASDHARQYLPHLVEATQPNPSERQSNSAAASIRATQVYDGLPLMFEANQGQTDPSVKFLSRGRGYTLFLAQKEAVLSLQAARPAETDPRKVHGRTNAGKELLRAGVLRVRFAGSRGSAEVVGRDQLSATSNYFLGDDSKQWRSNVRNFSEVEYRSVYPGIDVVFHGNQRQLEYDFDVAAGSDPSRISLEILGAKQIQVNAEGDAVLGVSDGEGVTIRKPVVYQEVAGRRQEVPGQFRLRDRNHLAFALGQYDRSLPLVIDPTLLYSTYLGGTTDDQANAVALYTPSTGTHAGQTLALLTGYTESTDFPVTSGTFQSTCPLSCKINAVAFVSEIDTTLSGQSSLIYSTYLGPTSTNDEFSFTAASGIAVDATNGNAVIVGETAASSFPTLGGFDTTNKSTSFTGFVTELNSTGTGLVYSTYLGGTGSDQASAVALDSSGDAYVVGSTSSSGLQRIVSGTLFPDGIHTNGLQAINGGTNGFVAEINSGGTALDFFGYLGGSTGDTLTGVALDASFNVYVTGYTASSDFPTKNAFQSTYAASASEALDAVFAEISSDGTALDYSTYLSGAAGSGSLAYGVAVANVSGTTYAYITGFSGALVSSTGTKFPTTAGVVGPGSSACVLSLVVTGSYSCPEMFVAKFNAAATASASLAYSTYLGGLNIGDAGETPYAIAVDASGNAYITGSAGDYLCATGVNGCASGNLNFPLPGVTIGPNPIQANPACPIAPAGGTCLASTAFLVELNPTATSVLYSTYLGTTAIGNNSTQIFTPSAQGSGIALDGSTPPNMYIAGSASAGALQMTPTTLASAFAPTPPSYPPSGAVQDAAFLTEISQTGTPPGLEYSTNSINFGSLITGWTSTPQTITVTNVSSGAITVNTPTPPGGAFLLQTPASGTECNGTAVASGNSCVIAVVFMPTANGLAGPTTLTIDSTDTTSPFSVSLSGMGTPPPFANYSASTLSFIATALDTPTTAETLTLMNTGSGPLAISSYQTAAVYPGTGSTFVVTSVQCTGGAATPYQPVTILGGQQCVFSVQFTADSTGTMLGTLIFDDNADTADSSIASQSVSTNVYSQTVNLSGTVSNTNTITSASATPASLSFGLQIDSVGAIPGIPVPAVPGSPMTVTLTNTSTTGSLTGIAPTVTGTNAGDFSLTPLGSCGATLAAAASCKINVTFAPSVSGGGAESATLSIADNASTEPQTVSLSGTGVPFVLTSPLTTVATIAAGGTGTLTFNVMLGPGTGILTLSCAALQGLLPGTTCTISPSSIPQTTSVQTVQVTATFTTTSPTAGAAFPDQRHVLPPVGLRRWVPLSLIAAILLLSLWMSLVAAPKPRARSAWAFLALIMLCGGWMAACGGGGGTSTTPAATGSTTPTPQGSYTFAVTAKLGSQTQTINVTLNVTP